MLKRKAKRRVVHHKDVINIYDDNLTGCLNQGMEEFSRMFDQKANEFFKRVFGMKTPITGEGEQSLMTTSEVITYFDISRTTLNNWINKDKIISIKKGNQRFFDRAYIERYKKVNFSFNDRLPTYYSKHV